MNVGQAVNASNGRNIIVKIIFAEEEKWKNIIKKKNLISELTEVQLKPFVESVGNWLRTAWFVITFGKIKIIIFCYNNPISI